MKATTVTFTKQELVQSLATAKAIVSFSLTELLANFSDVSFVEMSEENQDQMVEMYNVLQQLNRIGLESI